MVDEALILRKLSQLEEYQDQVREFAALSITDYSADWIKPGKVFAFFTPSAVKKFFSNLSYQPT